MTESNVHLVPEAAGWVWILGGTSGIGKEVAWYLGDLGLSTVSTGPDTDVRSSADLYADFKGYCKDMASRPSAAVYSVGVNYLEWLGRMGLPGLSRAANVLDVNATGFIRLMDVLAWDGVGVGPSNAEPMSVLAISSDAATRPLRTSISYCASKAALNAAVRVAARELGPQGWRINAISPGMVCDTGMSKYIDSRVPEVRGWTKEEALSYEESQEVVPGRVDPGEVAALAVKIMFDMPHMNGSIIELNGGR